VLGRESSEKIKFMRDLGDFLEKAFKILFSPEKKTSATI
jgi:hypothetical protein